METRQFQKIVMEYYRQHGRHDLPWRKTADPYKILVSEIMLQQTQVSRVIPYYKNFLKQFPSFAILARAPLSEVLRAWQGLGYNRRAKFLWQTAQIVTKEYKGKLPNDPLLLVKLPGIGKNTAGSILAFAFNDPAVFIETNIRRVFIYHFFSGKKSVHDKDILLLIEKTLEKNDPRIWYWALMDYGAHLASIVKNPNHTSHHYKKQSQFKGSDRQIRGRILKLLLEQKKASLLFMIKTLEQPRERIEKIATELAREGLISFHKKTATISG